MGGVHALLTLLRPPDSSSGGGEGQPLSSWRPCSPAVAGAAAWALGAAASNNARVQQQVFSPRVTYRPENRQEPTSQQQPKAFPNPKV